MPSNRIANLAVISYILALGLSIINLLFLIFFDLDISKWIFLVIKFIGIFWVVFIMIILIIGAWNSE